MTEKKNKEKIAIIPEEINEQIKALPKEDRDKIFQAIDDIAAGKIEGEPYEPVPMKVKLKCGSCESANINWVMEKNSREVYYNCNKCGEHGWMYEKEYKQALKKHPNLVIKND